VYSLARPPAGILESGRKQFNYIDSSQLISALRHSQIYLENMPANTAQRRVIDPENNPLISESPPNP
jgi:hypothetical protein